MFLSRIIKKILNFRLLCAITALLVSCMTLVSNAHAECQTSSDQEFFDLVAFKVEAYVPSSDADGNTYLQGSELEYARMNHYRKAYKAAPMVNLRYDRYASLTARVPKALQNLESKISIIDPECNEIRLFNNQLIGNVRISLESFLDMYARSMQLKHQKLNSFIKERVNIKPKSVIEIIGLLRADLRFDIGLLISLFSDNLLQSLQISKTPNVETGGELALLAFAKKGGTILGINSEEILKAYIMVPKSTRGLVDGHKSVLVLSTGEIFILPHLNFSLAAYSLSQMGVETTVLKLSEVFKGGKSLCSIDSVGYWYQILDGAKVRQCSFSELLVESLKDGSWMQSKDRAVYPQTFNNVSKFINQQKP